MITLSSDFGSPYPAAMKGVIRQRTDAPIEDISHSFPRQDVRTTAFWLKQILPYFPPSVHCVVVDPGVGTDRAAIVVRAGGHALVGPDNGVLLPAARAVADGEPDVFNWEITDPESTTFHGRDVFAPAAATIHEHRTERIETLGRAEPTDSWVDFQFPEPERTGTEVVGEILVVDEFGNAITNIPGDVIRDFVGDSVMVNDSFVPVRRAYAAVDPGNRLVTVGSHDNVELAVNRGCGNEAFAVSVGDSVTLEV
jgi:S-adenosylmethionine hydrolase